MCSKLRARVSELEGTFAAGTAVESNLRAELEHEADQVSNLREMVRKHEVLTAKLESENDHLTRRLREIELLKPAISPLQMSAASTHVAPELHSQCVEAGFDCTECNQHMNAVSALTEQVNRYRNSAKEAERLGEQLAKLNEEKDRLRMECKKLRKVIDPNMRKKPPSLEDATDPTDKVKQLEAKLRRVDDQWGRRLEALRVQHEQLKTEYESTIRDLTSVDARRRMRIVDVSPSAPSIVLPPPTSSATSCPDSRETEVLRARVKDLEDRVESVKQYYLMKLRAHVLAPPPKSGGAPRSVQKFSDLSLPTTSPQDRGPICPPLPERIATMGGWLDMLATCTRTLDREELTKDLVESDYARTSLVDRHTFIRALGYDLDRHIIQSLTDIYAYGDEQVDYKTFLSDLATRCGVFSVDLEFENRKLRDHVQSLMTELNERIEAFEGGHLLDTLEQANKELMRKDGELKLYKSELNKFLVGNRQLRRVSIGE